MVKEELTGKEIYEQIRKIQYLNMDEFSIEYCGRSASYLRTMTSKKKQLPTNVLVNITNKLIDRQALLTRLAVKDKHLVNELIETIATMIARRQTLHEHKKLRKMLLKIVDELNVEREYNAMPIIVV